MTERKKQRSKKKRFFVTFADLKQFEFSDEPITMAELYRRLGRLIDHRQMRYPGRTLIEAWLTHVGMLVPVEHGHYNKSKTPTEAGVKIGITQAIYETEGKAHPYLLLTRAAQEFIVTNMDLILTFARRRKSTF